MIAPPGLIAAAALFWGWYCGMFVAAIVLAILLEAWRFTAMRWELRSRDEQRISDFCTWVFVLVTGYYVVSKGWPLPVLLIVQWLPLVLAPLVGAQVYGTRRGIELASLFLSLRTESHDRQSAARVDLTFVYVLTCIVAAGASNERDPAYYIGVAVLAIWCLWGVRNPRWGLRVWVPVLSCALLLGYVGHVGLNRLQIAIFNFAIEYLQADLARTDPYKTATDIGHIGELKTSSRIVLRVDGPRDMSAPHLLHRASYNVYAAPTWIARDAGFTPNATAEGATILSPERAVAERSYTMHEVLTAGAGVLALPSGTTRIGGLGVAGVASNRMGTVRVERAPGPVTYTAWVAGDSLRAAEPTEHDLRIPARDRGMLVQTAASIAPPGTVEVQWVESLKRYFAANFRYTTYRGERVGPLEGLQEFLGVSRAGHCEYFATATVLLARAAGIPARYSTGYSVQEWSDIESRYVVRERHAHAWASLYIDGRWQFVDTTPPEWFGIERRTAPVWEGLADLWSWWMHRYDQWRDRPDSGATPPALIALAVLLAAWLVMRLARGGGFKRGRERAAAARGTSRRHDPDAAFYRIESYLAKRCGERGHAETLAEWLNRMRLPLSELQIAALRSMLRRHYRMRFDPQAMNTVERQQLAIDVQAWLGDVERQPRADRRSAGSHR